MEKQATHKIIDCPLIETDRLLLRLFEAADLETAYKLFNDAEVQKYLSEKNRRTREGLKVLLNNSVKYWKTRGYAMLCVADKTTDEMIGYCGFQCFDGTSDIEIVFGYRKEFWGQGIATEAARACLRFGYENLPFDKIYAATVPENTASQKVLKKIRMKYDEKTVHYEMNLLLFSVTRNEFLSSDFE